MCVHIHILIFDYWARACISSGDNEGRSDGSMVHPSDDPVSDELPAVRHCSDPSNAEVSGLGLGCRAQGLGLRVQGLGFRA